ncbi:MAG TPA: FAD-dependent oxidoreductase [Alphaproteobacteria bacterium]|jgi:predicted NAD/FAD-binding protein|nr:FAD-dependent oxidoreductase [Alphaproteobacteria bacterium]
MKIAVIGTGVAGLGCAWLLDQRHEITVYEAADRIGGHANTASVAVENHAVAVDTGFIVYNELNYPNLTRLFDHLGVATDPSDMSLGISLDDGRLEYAGDSLGGLFAQYRNLLKPSFYAMLGEVLRFYRQAPRVLTDAGFAQLTLGEYLGRHGFSRHFAQRHLLPMAAAIWSCPPNQMLEFPVVSFVRFCDNHGLLKVSDRPLWRTVAGGSDEYVRRLAAPFREKVRLSTAVRSVRRSRGIVEVTDNRGGTESYDHVVLACHADQSARLLGDASAAEADILGRFTYQTNRAILHRDPRLMPRRRRVWSSWNYIARSGRDDEPASVTYWMNRLQRLNCRADLFVSLNPIEEPSDALVEREFSYDHPVFDHRSVEAQRRLPEIQGNGGVWFCGSYCGWGFHEDALSSGLAVARALGSAPPWHIVPTQASAVAPAEARLLEHAG